MNPEVHYEAIATSYARHWSYTPQYVEWMSGCLAACLQLGENDLLADVGCGVGLYAQRLAEYVRHVVCLDPCAAMLRQIPTGPGLSCVQATAEDFATQRVLPGQVYDAVLLKEVVHHLSDRPTVIGNLVARLAPAAGLVIAMLPTTVDYPLFQAALGRYRSGTEVISARSASMDPSGGRQDRDDTPTGRNAGSRRGALGRRGLAEDHLYREGST